MAGIAAANDGTDGSAEQLMVDEKLKHEQEIVEQRAGLGEMPDATLTDFGFAVKRLHDPCNYDHTTLEDMLATYHARDLGKSKLFRIAKKIFGDKMDSKYRIRNRTFNLVGLKNGSPVLAGSNQKHTADEVPDSFEQEEDEDLVDMNDLNLRRKIFGTSSKADQKSVRDRHPTESAIADYHLWLEERKNLRDNINSVGLNESWLRNKDDKTAMEQLLYDQMLYDKYSAQILEREKKLAEAAARAEAERLAALSVPRIRRPSPIAIRKLDMFLKTNKLRLIDVFSAIDKDKNWHLSKEEFKNAIELLLKQNEEKYGMDISPSLLEDLITTLDVDQSGEVSYKELVKGLELYQKEKRDVKKKGLPMPQDDEEDEDDGGTRTSTPFKTPASSRQPSGKKLSSGASSKPPSASRHESRGSSATTLLATPDLDLQESKLVLQSQENQVDLRKRDKNFLQYYNKIVSQQRSSPASRALTSMDPSRSASKATVFKTGYKPVDDHCRASQLEGEAGAMTDEFRQLKLKEYHSIIRLCDKEGVVLSRNLLDAVLLHPGDKTTRQMLRQGIRQPGAGLPLSQHFAEPPKKPRTPIEIRNKGKIKRGRDGQLLIDYKHRFPSQAKSSPVGHKVQLSTGKAVVARKVDCWMTFEEYEAMTSSYYTKRYVRMEPDQNSSNLTWTGHMLNKMRIYLEHDRTADQSNSLFREVKREPRAYHGYDNDLNNWQVSDAGYLRQGNLRDPRKQYTSTNLQPTFPSSQTFNNNQLHKNTAGLTMHTKHS